jgi:hypothetical protein
LELISVQLEGFGCFPGAVEDAEVDVRPFRVVTGLPLYHVLYIAGRNDRSFRVEDGNQRFGILQNDARPHMLTNLAHIERYDEAPV